MRLGMVGLGRMGGNMTERLVLAGHEVVVHDRSADAVAASAAKGATASTSLPDLVSQLDAPRVVWVMVPAGEATRTTIAGLGDVLEAGDVVVDGGNSNWKHTEAHAAILRDRGIALLDCGTSGGIWGLKEGYCLMVGGSPEAFAIAEPIFKALAPEGGYLHVDDASGAGHFVKMVHNGIEYAMMQAYGEGLAIIEKSPFEVEQSALCHLWTKGSVVRSWLLELLASALETSPKLEDLKGRVDDSGEGRWTVDAAVEEGVPAYVISAALFARFASQEENAYGLRVLAALRHAFGGHAVHRLFPGDG